MNLSLHLKRGTEEDTDSETFNCYREQCGAVCFYCSVVIDAAMVTEDVSKLTANALGRGL